MDGCVAACLVKLLVRDGVGVDAEKDVVSKGSYRVVSKSRERRGPEFLPWKSVAS